MPIDCTPVTDLMASVLNVEQNCLFINDDIVMATYKYRYLLQSNKSTNYTVQCKAGTFILRLTDFIRISDKVQLECMAVSVSKLNHRRACASQFNLRTT